MLSLARLTWDCCRYWLQGLYRSGGCWSVVAGQGQFEFELRRLSEPSLASSLFVRPFVSLDYRGVQFR